MELFEAAPEGAAVPGTELHQVALAHIAAGLQLQSPPHIRTADKMLSFMASSCRCGPAAITFAQVSSQSQRPGREPRT